MNKDTILALIAGCLVGYLLYDPVISFLGLNQLDPEPKKIDAYPWIVDDQTVDTIRLPDTTLQISLELDDFEAPYTVDLSPLECDINTDGQTLDTIRFNDVILKVRFDPSTGLHLFHVVKFFDQQDE